MANELVACGWAGAVMEAVCRWAGAVMWQGRGRNAQNHYFSRFRVIHQPTYGRTHTDTQTHRHTQVHADSLSYSRLSCDKKEAELKTLLG